ncbi:MAG: serine/threonine-protein kinase [Ferruginibacter sp.]
MGYADEKITEVAGYRLTEKIGSGGMGDVYKAINPSLNRQAAVKILHQEAFADRFKNEAYIQSSINHPNIARLYEYTKVGNRLCIVMEYIDGETLSSLLHRKGKLSNEETESILRQIVSALAYLHKKEIVHRDIKPSNFKITADGTVKMLDFGIAKHKYSPKLTQMGFVVGTMEYIAPEQFDQKEELKSDVWCLCVMAYELLTGYMPFEATNVAVLRVKIIKGSFTDPKLLVPVISEKLAMIIDRGLKVNPVNRISAAEIEGVLGNHKAGNRPTMLNKLSFQQPSKKTITIGGAAIIVFLLVFILINNKPDIQPDKPAKGILVPAEKQTVSINVPGISNAVLISTDNERIPLPYSIIGNEGDKFEFIIHAEGYEDKKVQVVINPRRNAFEYNLEKINK